MAYHSKTIEASKKEKTKVKFHLYPTDSQDQELWPLRVKGGDKTKYDFLKIRFPDSDDKSVKVVFTLKKDDWVFLEPSQVNGGTWTDSSKEGYCTKTSDSGIEILTPSSMTDYVGSEDHIGIWIDSDTSKGNLPDSQFMDDSEQTIFVKVHRGDHSTINYSFVAYLPNGENSYIGYATLDPSFTVRCK